MKLESNLRSILLTLLTVGLFAAPGAFAAPPLTQGVKLTPIGQPTWTPADFHMFSATIGTEATGYVEFYDTALALMPPPNHVFSPYLLVGPGAPHSPPYDHELADGVANLGFVDGVQFPVSGFSNGSGVYVVFMLLPAPGTSGRSPDFASGPIIPNSLFPIHLYVTDEHNGKFFSIVSIYDVPPLDADVGFPGMDGHSHVPLFFADNADFGPEGSKLRGSYRYLFTFTDQSGSGWNIEAHFAVAP
jgi:hypothetical protein